MKRFLLFACLLLAFALPARAQNLTSTSATVVDSAGTAYTFGTYTATLVNNTGQPALFGGNANFQKTYQGGLDTNGFFSVVLPSVTVMTPTGMQWSFFICANPQTIAYLFPKPTLPCFTYTSTGTQVSGSSVDLSASLTAVAAVIPKTVATNGNNAFSGNNTHSGAEAFAQVSKTFYADGATYTTIQAALNAAPSGATVIVPAGCSGTVAVPPATITITQAVHLILQCDVTSSQSPNISILSSGVTIEGNGDNSRPATGTNAPTWTNSGSGNTIIYGDGTLAYRGLILDKLNFLKSTPATSANILFRANAADITVRDIVTDGLGFDASAGNQELNRYERVRVNRAVNVGLNYNCTVVCNSIVFNSTYANATSGTGIGYDLGNINATFHGSDVDSGAIGYRFVGVGQVVAVGADSESNTTAGWQITGATGQVSLLAVKTGAEVLPFSITGAASVTIVNPFTTSTSGANSLVVGAGATGQNLLIADSGFDKPISITGPGSIQRIGSLAALQGPLTLQNLTSAPGLTIPIDTVSVGAALRISDTHAGGCNWDQGEIFGVTIFDIRATSCGGGGVAFNSNSAAGRGIFTFTNTADRIYTLPNAAITVAGINFAQTWSATQTFAAGSGNPDIKPARVMMSGTAPTCTFTSGGGTTPSCALDTGSTDSGGMIIATTGTGAPAALGTITLTFSSTFGTNKPSCVYTLSSNGAGQWNTRATVMDKTPATGSDLFNWDNNGATLALSTAFWINFHCFAK